MDTRPPLSVAIIGVGLVGREVVRQLLLPHLCPRFALVSLHTSTLRLLLPFNASQSFSADTILSALLGTASGELKATKYAGGVQGVVASLDALPRPLIVVDCTSSAAVAQLYPTIISAPLTHLVTPNKKAFSASEALWSAIKQVQGNTGNLVYHEATVGAGLPILSTLKELVVTGDKINKIEGVFSGTFSYLFNNFSPAKKPVGGEKVTWSEAVKEAKDKGYTEPHPADDLNGTDVARKLTILARLSSLPSSLSLPSISLAEGFASVPTQSLVPKRLEQLDAEKFIVELPGFDAEMDKLREEAEAEGSVLRYVGVIDLSASDPKDQVKCSLQKYPLAHPFASALSGSDNIVAFHTARYSPQPLIVQGAGAGAAVTAMGVVGDMVKVFERVYGGHL